jgi:AcrR family transcriptional regulator
VDVRSPRQRYRDQTRAEAKQVALDQLAESGSSGISVNAIAKKMGVTGPALYRYFANRDALLTELIVDGYRDLAEAIENAAAEHRRKAPATRFKELAARLRSWALEQPHRYLLLFGTPVPGYRAPELTSELADRPMRVFLEVLADLAPDDLAAARSTLDRQLVAWRTARGDANVPPALARRALFTWTRVHGLISLEIEGQLAGTAVNPELLFRHEVQNLLNEPWS